MLSVRVIRPGEHHLFCDSRAGQTRSIAQEVELGNNADIQSIDMNGILPCVAALTRLHRSSYLALISSPVTLKKPIVSQ